MLGKPETFCFTWNQENLTDLLFLSLLTLESWPGTFHAFLPRLASEHQLTVTIPHPRSLKQRSMHLPAKGTSKHYLLSPHSLPSLFPDARIPLILATSPELQHELSKPPLLSEILTVQQTLPRRPDQDAHLPVSPPLS